TIIAKIREALDSPHQGFNIPRTAAIACDILGNVETLTRLFDDFLLHCQELFAQLPNYRRFDELRDWTELERDEKTQIVDLMIDRLQSPEIDAGNRLLFAICKLCSASGNEIGRAHV